MPAPAAPGTTGLDECLDVNRLTAAARAFVAAIAGRPDVALRLAKMSLVFRTERQATDARVLARAAQRLAPCDERIRALTDWTQRDEAPLWHFGIVHDQLRNETYAHALQHFVRPDMTVFEIGTGTGLLAMLAVQAGARHVYTCERRLEVAAAACAIIQRNGFSERITVIAKDAHAVRLGADLPGPADLFVAELVDNSLLGEDVLSLTELARAKFLKPDAVLLPRQVSAIGCLVSGQGHRERYRMDRVLGFDLTPFNRFAPVMINAGKAGGEVDPLSDAVALVHFDLRVDAPAEASRRVTLTANRAGQVEGILRWLRLDFGDGIVFENRPPQRSHWDPMLHVLSQCRQLESGDAVEVEVYHQRHRLFVLPVAVP